MQDYRAIANQLIQALKNAASANIASLETQRTNAFEDITNNSNARGTLYSTSTGYKQLRTDAEKFQPAIAAEQRKAVEGEIQIKSDLLDTSRKIDALNKAASELAGITFSELLV